LVFNNPNTYFQIFLPSFSKNKALFAKLFQRFLCPFRGFSAGYEGKRAVFDFWGVFQIFQLGALCPGMGFRFRAKRNRFASEIAWFSKPLISLRSQMSGFRGFERYQGVERFAKRFFIFLRARPANGRCRRGGSGNAEVSFG
jgi:hypothetical protein